MAGHPARIWPLEESLRSGHMRYAEALALGDDIAPVVIKVMCEKNLTHTKTYRRALEAQERENAARMRRERRQGEHRTEYPPLKSDPLGAIYGVLTGLRLGRELRKRN